MIELDSELTPEVIGNNTNQKFKGKLIFIFHTGFVTLTKMNLLDLFNDYKSHTLHDNDIHATVYILDTMCSGQSVLAPLLDDPRPGRLNVGLEKGFDLVITVLVKVVFIDFILCEYFVKVGKMFV